MDTGNSDSSDISDSEKENRRHTKRSRLANANSKGTHSQPKQRRAIEQRISFQHNNYWAALSGYCDRHKEGESNCLLQYYKNDMNLLLAAAKAKGEELKLRTKDEHNAAVHAHLSSLNTKRNNENSQTDYKIQLSRGVQVTCCKQCYMRYNFISRRQLENSRKANKKGNTIDINHRKERTSQDGPIFEMSGVEFSNLLQRNNINDAEYIRNYLPYAFAPSGDNKELCIQWMDDYFVTYGDQQPNSYINYLSESFKKDIYQQYKQDMEKIGKIPVAQDSFNGIWINCFPFVQLREECNIIGKCKVCAKSAELRKDTSQIKKQAGKDMHMLHRCYFKPERCAYQSRIRHALENPMKIFSLCIDIMDSYALGTPYAGRQYKFSKCFDSVVVGAYVHGDSTAANPAHWKRLRLYRTWNTVGKCSNLIIHVFLKALEEWIQLHNGQTPDIIYLQVDGGSENANNAFLSMLQLIVNKQLCNQLVYSRLPTGHGHTDNDGGFGTVKEIIKQAVLAGWDSFEKEVTRRLGEECSMLNCSVENIYVINDWETYIKPYQTEFSGLHKLDLTLHQILFERVDCDFKYPFQVKVSTRAYCSQRVIELIPAPRPSTELGALTGFDPVDTLVKWFSESEEGDIISFLNDIPPAGKLPFLPLIANCVKLIDEVMGEILHSNCPIITPQVKQDYVTWRSAWLPREDDVVNLEIYANRINFMTPLFVIWETDEFPYKKSDRMEPKITSFHDEEFDQKYETLKAITMASLRLDQPSTRAFKISSELAERIMNKIIATNEFKLFQEEVKGHHNNFGKFYEEHCKFSLHNIMKYVKPKAVGGTREAVTLFLQSFLVMLYTPLLKSYEAHVNRMIADKKPDDVVTIIKVQGIRHKILAKQLTKFNVDTLNLLMHLFNARETDLYNSYQSQSKPQNYTKVYFQCAETMVHVFDQSKSASLGSLAMYSKVIYPHRVKLGDNKFSINLIIMLPQEKKIYFLDPARDRDMVMMVLPIIREQFDRYYNETFTIELYSTTPRNILIDSFAKLQSLSNDEPYIYMYIMIYYVLFRCPLIFDFDDINTNHIKNKIMYELMNGELSI